MQKIRKNKILNKWILVIISIFLFISTVTIGFISVGYSKVENEDSFGFVDTIDLIDSGDATWNCGSGSILGSVTGEGGGMCGGSPSAKNGTLTIKYLGTLEGIISFDYDLTLNGGNCTIDNKDVTISGSETINISEDYSSFEIKIESASGNKTTTINIKNFSCTVNEPITLTFLPSQNGNYTVNGNQINEQFVLETNGITSFTLQCQPDEGYSFAGWSFDGNIINNKNPLTMTYGNDATIFPVFYSNELALFTNNGKNFYDLQEAIDSANNSSDKTIRLIKSGIIESSKSYELRNGIALFIPNSETATMYDDNYEQALVETSLGTAKEYLNLVIPDNTTINIYDNSMIYVGGVAFVTSSASTCYVTGGYGHISLSGTNSTINLYNSSKLYCYGYITGNGIVNAYSGAKVNELFQITGWRGGTKALSMLNNSQKVFLVNQYYIQNIETQFRIYKGANLEVITGVTVTLFGKQATSTIFLGDSGVFIIEEGYIERVYDYENDRIIYNIEGNANLSSITLKLQVNLESANYILPITNNFEINVVGNSSIEISQNLCLLPGVKLLIDENAQIRFSDNTSLIVYDNDVWFGKNYACTHDIEVINYAASLNKKPARTLTADSPDAEIDLNGEMILNNGAAIYTTLSYDENKNVKGAANIHTSKGTGKIRYVQGLGTETVTYQKPNNSDDYDSIPIAPAYLKNGVTASTEYFIPSNVEGGINGKTVLFNKETEERTLEENTSVTYNLTYVNDENNQINQSSYTVNESFVLPTAEESGFSYKNFTLKYWEIPNQGIYKPGSTVALGDLGNIEVRAVWGGWINTNGESFYIDYNSGEYLKGLNKVMSQENLLEICLFDENTGSFKDDYIGVYKNSKDNKNYYVLHGKVVETSGFMNIPIDLANFIYEYIFIQEDNSLLTNGTYYVESKDDNALPSGYYTFDESGYIIKEDADTNNYNGSVYITNVNDQGDATYIDGIRISYGLFLYNGHYYYSDSEGLIVKDKTFYISKVNDTGIKEGLYYFDSEGRMYDENFNLIEVN